MDRMKALLDQDGIEYNEKIFETNRGIAGLGSNPFVSFPACTVEL